MSDLGSRWAAWQTTVERDGADYNESTGTQNDLQHFGLSAHGELVCFDQEGYFKVVGIGAGEDPTESGHMVPNVYVLRDHNGVQEPAYIEPIYVAGFIDHFYSMFSEPYGWDVAE